MAKHARIRTDEQRQRLERNRQIMLAALKGDADQRGDSIQTAGLTLVLERIVCDHATGCPVPFEGPYGVERILHQLTGTYVGGEIVCEGRLVGVRGALAIEGRDETIGLRASVGVGAQLVLEVGPSRSITGLIDAIRVFDRQAHLAARALGREYDLVAQGLSPVVSPSDIVPVPLRRNVLLGTYLVRSGRFAKDALRCSAMTRLCLPMPQDEREAVAIFRLFTALAPLLSFLCDNTLSLRGCAPADTPPMARQLVWQQMDPARHATMPSVLRESFGLASYERWLESVRPILFESDEGIVFSTGTDTCEYVMEERDLTPMEAKRLAHSVWPDVRFDGRIELRCADSLPPRLAGGYAALVKGLLATPDIRQAVERLVGIGEIEELDLDQIYHDLREMGWNARVFKRWVDQLANELVVLALRGLDDMEERRLLSELAQLWEARMVPRDALVTNWENAQRSDLDEAIALYGEGAVIPYEELGGDPPAGSTAVMRPIRQ